MKNKYLMLINTLLLIGIFLMPTSVFADEDEGNEPEPGQMLIDREAIHDGPEIDYARVRAIGHEVAPFLFLEDMTRIEQQRQQDNEAFLESVREMVFLEESPRLGLDTGEIVASLFGEYETQTGLHVGARTHMGYFHVPPWLLVVGGIILTGLLVYGAVILGQKLGHVIHRKKENEESG